MGYSRGLFVIEDSVFFVIEDSVVEDMGWLGIESREVNSCFFCVVFFYICSRY